MFLNYVNDFITNFCRFPTLFSYPLSMTPAKLWKLKTQHKDILPELVKEKNKNYILKNTFNMLMLYKLLFMLLKLLSIM